THPHPDHLDGLVALARNFRIGEFWEGFPSPDEGIYAALCRSLPARVFRRRLGRGDHFEIGPVAVDVLHPPRAGPDAGPVPAANENSLVIKMTIAGTSVLFMGDAGADTERGLLRSGLDLRTTVLKAGHHGSAASTSADFLAAVRPRLVLVSAGEGNTYGFPSPALLARCAAAGAEVLRADLDGAVEIRADGRRLAVRTAAVHRYGENPDFRLTRTTKSMIIALD
ncbi:MAG: ComEC/Rec2 family competence protein, partial [Candidatus Aminicenantes bacterium RBG_16_66_30]